MAAIAVRSLEAHVTRGGDRRLRSLTCRYLSSPAMGSLELEVELVRSGRRFSTGQLTAHRDGKKVLIALASFAVPDLAIATIWTPPARDVHRAPSRDAGVASPEEYRPQDGRWLSRVDGLGTLTERLRYAPRFGSGRPFVSAGVAPGSGPQTGGWIVLDEPQPIDDLTIHIRADILPGGLPDQPILGRYSSSASIGGLVEEDGELFLADGTLLAQSRQLALLTPLSPR